MRKSFREGRQGLLGGGAASVAYLPPGRLGEHARVRVECWLTGGMLKAGSQPTLCPL